MISVQVRFATIQGFWQGLIIQASLLLAPIALVLQRRAPAWIGLRRAGLRRSLAIGGGLAGLYLLALAALAIAGKQLPHFDGARAQLGLLPVLALYIPFWGVVESVWTVTVIRIVSRWLGGRTDSWPAILLSGLWFGTLHVVVQVLQGAPLPEAAVAVCTGAFAVLAGALLRLTGNAWGYVLFWTVVDF